MQLVSAGLENHPDGSGNINNIVNGNWNNIEAWFNPAAGYTASQSGTTVTASSAVFGTWDVGSTIRFADGTTDTIASVTSPTVVEVGVSRTVGSQAFYLYETGEALRGTLLRGLLGVTQIDATAHDNAFLVVNATTEKLEAVSGLTYDGSDFTFTEPVVIDDDDGAQSTEAMVTIRRNMVATSGSNWSFVMAATVEPAGASTAKTTAGYFTINTTGAGGNITTGGTGIGVNGLYVNPGHSNTTYTLDLLTGLYVLCTHGSGAANLAQMDGITIYMDAAAASTADLVRGLYIPTIQRSGGADEWWAIYTAGTQDNSFFAGKVIVSDDDTSGDETFSTDRLAIHAEGTYGTTSKAAVDIDAQNTYTSTGSATTVGAFFKARHTGSGSMTGSDGLIGGYAWATNNSTSTGTHSGDVVGLYARAEVGSSAGNGTQSELIGVRTRIENNQAGATVSTGIGLLVLGSIATGTITNRWGIRQEGTSDRNLFAGTTQFDGIRGSMYQTNTSTTVTVSVTDTWYEITTGWTDGGNGNDTTFQNSHEILIATAGVYWVAWHIAVTVGTAAQNVEAAITVNGTADTSVSNHCYVANTTVDEPISGQGLVSLSASDVVALAVRNRTGANNITVEHAGLTLFCVGT